MARDFVQDSAMHLSASGGFTPWGRCDRCGAAKGWEQSPNGSGDTTCPNGCKFDEQYNWAGYNDEHGRTPEGQERREHLNALIEATRLHKEAEHPFGLYGCKEAACVSAIEEHAGRA